VVAWQEECNSVLSIGTVKDEAEPKPVRSLASLLANGKVEVFHFKRPARKSRMRRTLEWYLFHAVIGDMIY